MPARNARKWTEIVKERPLKATPPAFSIPLSCKGLWASYHLSHTDDGQPLVWLYSCTCSAFNFVLWIFFSSFHNGALRSKKVILPGKVLYLSYIALWKVIWFTWFYIFISFCTYRYNKQGYTLKNWVEELSYEMFYPLESTNFFWLKSVSLIDVSCFMGKYQNQGGWFRPNDGKRWKKTLIFACFLWFWKTCKFTTWWG